MSWSRSGPSNPGVRAASSGDWQLSGWQAGLCPPGRASAADSGSGQGLASGAPTSATRSVGSASARAPERAQRCLSSAARSSAVSAWCRACSSALMDARCCRCLSWRSRSSSACLSWASRSKASRSAVSLSVISLRCSKSLWGQQNRQPRKHQALHSPPGKRDRGHVAAPPSATNGPRRTRSKKPQGHCRHTGAPHTAGVAVTTGRRARQGGRQGN